MKFPESWLRQHISTDASHQRIAETLTAIGLEVEQDTVIGAVLPGVIVAEIVALEKHPEADRLNVCQVAIGGGEQVQIVCGAPNARAGLKAPLAQIGAVLPGDFAIKAAKLRGIDSAGMLCSAKELGIDADASGLLELPADAPVGTLLSDYLGLPDAQFELKLTPNRADCFSIRGIAFDLAAALQTQVTAMPISEVAVSSLAQIAINVEAKVDCPRYAGRVVEGLNPQAVTPIWMREALLRCGIRPVSPLVDITQFVMLELGQPMHAFDADKLQGPIGVRRARDGETCTLLDGKQAVLSAEFTVITDAERAIAVAGIMGGLDTSVTEKTTRVFLESAHFAPASIIGRARKLGLHTDASHRFERGVDPALPLLALERASGLVIEIMGGKAGPVVCADAPEHIAIAAPVLLRHKRLTRVLGIEVEAERVQQIFRALGMQVQAHADGWLITPPSRRFDMAIEEDMIEEVARIVGYDQIPLRTPSGEVPLVARSEIALDEYALRAQLLAQDVQETINYAFIDAGLLQTWQMQEANLVLANPLSAELAVMRPSLLPGLVSTLTANAARQQTRLRLFEIGRVFSEQGAHAPLERQHAAAVFCGSAMAEQWSAKPEPVDFYDVKTVLDAALARIGLQADYAPAALPHLHPGRSANVLVDGRLVGVIGALHPALNKALDLPGDVYAFEFDLSALPKRKLPEAQPVSRFPSVRRDLALLVPEAMNWAEIEACSHRTLGPRLHSASLFDVYRGAGLPVGTKSLAMGLILHEYSRTLNDSEIEQSMADLLTALAQDCQATLRA
jgi:phenylalanyl-tRNA synthetase beta chain